MGNEIIFLLLPFMAVHMAYVVYRSAEPGRRLRALLLTSLAVAGAVLFVRLDGGSVELFLFFGGLLYVVVVVPVSVFKLRSARGSAKR